MTFSRRFDKSKPDFCITGFSYTTPVVPRIFAYSSYGERHGE
ncbi:MAG: hypothetical protein P1U87_00810 [Verrucomicrobiales bacterium]|nr:hypothetical protein [Verrucomicrobiales bacterium]